MKKIGLLALMVVVALGFEILPTPHALAGDSRAEEILKAARAAIGGEALLQSVQGFSVKGQYRRVLGEREFSGDREISILLPDKYLAEDEFNQGGLSTAMITTRGLNGVRAWSGSSGGEGGHMIIRMGSGAQQATPDQMEAMLRRQYQAEFTRYLLAIMVMPPPSLAVEYKYAGEADVEDAHADVIDVNGPDKLAFRLFFDKQTHLPLLLSYRGNKPRIMTAFNRSPDRNVKPEEAAKKAREEVEKKMAAEPAPKPEEVDFFIRLTEYRKINGLSLPHKLTFLTESEVSEEFQISRYQLNPPFKTDKFQKH